LNRAIFLEVSGGAAPSFACEVVQTGTPPGGAVKTYGLFVSAGSWANSDTRGGINGFDYNLTAFQSQLIVTNCEFQDAGDDAVNIAGGSAYLFGCDGTGAGARGLVVSGGAKVHSGDTGEGSVSWRKTIGADSATDVVVSTGAVIVKEGTPSLFGGTNIPLNQWGANGGIIYDTNAAMNPRGILSLETYTVATVPSAAAYTRPLIFVSDGATGQPCLAVPFGGEWKRIATGTTIAAS